MFDFMEKISERKVEYVELIYDLIFVYLIGRNNALLHNIENGFFGLNTYVVYLISTLVILQVWYFSTLFINRYGSNSLKDYICLFINMYLLYYMADGTRADWSGYYIRYNVAWGMIILNLAYQYWSIMRKCKGNAPWMAKHLKYHMICLLIQAGIVFCGIPVYSLTEVPVSWISLIGGFIIALMTVRIDELIPVNTEHLTERVMLFVVFTFGEVIVGIASYFKDTFSVSTVFFSIMAFAIVVGLFMSYGYIYDNVIDRQRNNIEMKYMMLHIGLIIALNNITAAMEFMRDQRVSMYAKNIFIIGSFFMYYIFLFLIGHYAKEGCQAGRKFFTELLVISLVFMGIMAFCYNNGWYSITLSVIYVYAMLGMIVMRWHGVKKEV